MRALLFIGRFFLPFIFLCSTPHAWAIPVEKIPNPRVLTGRWVQDGAGVLSSGYDELINTTCTALEAQTTVELAVVTVNGLDDLSVEDYAQKLFQKWGIGKKDKNNGLLILFARDDRKVRIHSGYGLEHIITDATSGKLLDQWAVPRFKEGAYGRGLYDLTKATALTVASGLGVELPLTDPDTFPEEVAVAPTPTSDSDPSRRIQEAYWSWAHVGLYLGGLVAFTFFGLLWTGARVFFSRALAAKQQAIGSGIFFGIVAWFLGGIAAVGYGAVSSRYISSLAIYGGGTTLMTLFRSLILKMFQKYISHYHCKCPKCGKPMMRLGEKEDDKYLSGEEVAEELAKGMDYEFWNCDACDYQHRFDVKLGGASKCPKCTRRSLESQSTTLESATTTRSGRMRVTYDCRNPKCSYRREELRTIPRISSSSGSSSGSSWRSSSGGGSFGGGSSGGGGASRSW